MNPVIAKQDLAPCGVEPDVAFIAAPETKSAVEPLVEDGLLVAKSLDGDREAFRQIVERHQNLICSLTYSALGDVSRSEDVAQDVFLLAWKRLGDLREPAKLRPWLCGIMRFVIRNELRKRGRQPLHAAESLEAIAEQAGSEPLPSDRVISQEELALLWRSLEQIPEAYREPLVFFYREHQSVEQVADALELSEDAVKQRLARGRKVLAEQMMTFVEGALASTRPGTSFTLAVVGALPLLAMTARAATATAAAKSSATTKTATALGTLGAVVTGGVLLVVSAIGFLMFVGACVGFVMSRASGRSARQCEHVISFWKTVAIGLSLSAVIPTLWFVWEPNQVPRIVYSVMTGWFAFAHPVVLGALALWIWRWRRGGSVLEAPGLLEDRSQKKRLGYWLVLGLIVPVCFCVYLVPGWLRDGAITKKQITPAEARELITHRKDGRFSVTHLPRGTAMVINLPEHKNEMLVTLADDAMLELLSKNGIPFTSQGVERVDSDLFRLLAQLLGLWSSALVPAGAVLLVRQNRKKGRHHYPPTPEAAFPQPGLGEKRAWKAFAASIALVMLGLAGFLGLVTRWAAYPLSAAKFAETIADLQGAKFQVFQYANGSKELWICHNLNPDFIAPADDAALGLLAQKGIAYETFIQGRDFGYAMPGKFVALICIALLLAGAGCILWRVAPKTLLTGTALAMLLVGLGLGLLTGWHAKSVSDPEARRLISEGNPRVEVVKFKNGTRELWLTLPGNTKPPSMVAPANAATLAWLDKNQVQYQTLVQGRDFGYDTPRRGTALGWLALLVLAAASLVRWAYAIRSRPVTQSLS